MAFLSGVLSYSRILLLTFGLMIAIQTPSPAFAQTAHAETPAEGGIDYPTWELMVQKAEAALAEGGQSTLELEKMRAALVEWRNQFTAAQSRNASRIATVRSQIEALGPVPSDGSSEAPEILIRRDELNKQLRELQAPGISAEEAYRHADGVIREIDKNLRLQQADELLQIWPSPLNPGNWPDATMAVFTTVDDIWKEFDKGWHNPVARQEALDNLPAILALLAFAVATIFFARHWIRGAEERVYTKVSPAARGLVASLVSLLEMVVPVLGFFALSEALDMTDMLGTLSQDLVDALPWMALSIYSMSWLAYRNARNFIPADEHQHLHAHPTSAHKSLFAKKIGSVRNLGDYTMAGVVVALEIFRAVAMDHDNYSPAVSSVISFPILCLGALILWRLGRILKRFGQNLEGPSYIVTLIGLVAKLCSFVAICAPILAAFGYVLAAKSMVFPAILSLALFALALFVQSMLMEAWQILVPGQSHGRLNEICDGTSEEEEGAGKASLASVVFGFVLTLLCLPCLALIWGARISDLTELWTSFQAGFQLGDAKISPSDFLLFALLFVLGYMATRLVQGALRNTILPRTNMDRGGQNAIVSGVGYIGIFLSALIAIRSTGIDLSGFAIVASALSVGIGFGLQNIVQNFVSGVILMIERPVSEGDWIEVGTTQGIVKTISVRSTRIQTFDRNVVVVPNADLVSQRVTNWTRFGLAGRVIVSVGVAYGTDTRLVERVLREIGEAQPMVILNPPPSVMFKGLGPDGMNFELRMVLRDVNSSSSVVSEVNHEIIARFAQEGIDIAHAQREVRLTNIGELARLAEAHSVKAEPFERPSQPE